MNRISCFFFVTCLTLGTTNVRSQSIDEVVVTSKRLSDSLSLSVYSSEDIQRTALDGPALGLDDALRHIPGFGLFRRQASRAAHPTTQGVSLRGLGPNGAGRTLVLLDGIPLNDPFGGWVEWVHLPPNSIHQATLVRGGGSGTWGNSALAGVVRLDSRILFGTSVNADIRAGSKESVAGSALVAAETANGVISAVAHFSESDGYFLLSPPQRGTADRPTERQNEGVRLGWRTETESGTVWSLTGSAASDRFVNGAVEALVETDTYDVALGAYNDKPGSGPSWEAHLYARRKDFQSVFVAFDATRDSASPVLDQFDVPALGLGGNVLARWSGLGAWTIESGADVRFADGETNEQFRNLGAGFTRERQAGGEQIIAGAFVEGHRETAEGTLFTFGARADYWRQSKGMRQESDLADGSLLIDRTFANRDGIALNGRAGISTPLSETLDLRATAYSGFRVPTLNELYRPFRVGNDITEANENLVNERMAGAEVGLEFTTERASAQATIFRNDLFDPILNTTVTTASGFNAEFGVFIPTGGSLRQRRNVDRVETWGLELDAKFMLSDDVEVRAGYLFSNPKIKRSGISPDLEGNRLAQVAKHQGSVGVAVAATDRLKLTADALFSGKQFEDDLNTRVLKDAVTVDVYAGYQLSDAVELYLAAENLFDQRVEAGKTASGLVTLGPSMFLWMGLRLNY